MPDSSPRLSARFARLPASVLLGALWVYQRTVSPFLPVVFGPGCGCRFAPTCSHYAAAAVREHGALMGSFLALRRLAKCTPLHPGGFDPVPPRRRPRCHAIVRATPHSPSRAG
jgi:putative membrane protein insertion efficiency factor